MPTVHAEENASSSSVHLDAVRGLAALTVMTFHLKAFFFSSLSDPKEASRNEGLITTSHTTPPTAPVPRRSDMGNTPVMIFFVLSGYLVGGSVLRSIKRNRWSSLEYLTKRLTRLWVVLIPALLLGVALDNFGPLIFAHPGGIYFTRIAYVYPHVEQDLRASTIVANMFFLQGTFVNTAGTNGALWSLTNEFWYYLLFPLLVVPIMLRRPVWIMTSAIAVVVAFLTFVSLYTPPSALKHIAFLFPIWLFGAVVAKMPLVVPKHYRNVLTFLMIVAVISGTIVIRRIDIGVRGSQYVIALLFTALLYLLLHYPEKAKDGVYKSVAGFFSRISYSLYLIHMPLGAFLAALLLQPWHLREKTPLTFLLYLGFCGLIILITYLFYLAFEANTDRIRKFVFSKEGRLSGASDRANIALKSSQPHK